ncbi:GNAT family N-acetyltransferase [Prevotella sp. oral taxon 376]|uniref:GNAT family N-acetyltransferase n=1 Tax=Prevotella sp. oral taxon 376 TaxID=712466 RepID=UPI000D1DCEEB|nr:GNAT family N-acetyltransferase [Prevotella sp. oral taxon 376]PTL32560.1 GNAT family N-acetyltransferase [Prevotella sp. oral taxon 376]
MRKVNFRALEPEDLDMLYKIENDGALWRVGNTNVPYSRYALHDYIAHASNDIYTDKQVRLMIEDAEGHPVGILDLVDFNPKHLRAEVGIVVESRYRHQGLATAALREAIEYSRRVLHLHQIYAVVDMENEEALALFRKQNFTGDTILKHWLFDGKRYHDALMMHFFL